MNSVDIKVLDCTLRDGGYINNWNFGKENIEEIGKKLFEAQVDILECGYLSCKAKFDGNSTKYNKIENIHQKCQNCVGNTELACMINYGEVDERDLPVANEVSVKILRIAFHKKDIIGAMGLAKKLKEKGYKVFIQPMLTISYSDSELLELVNLVNDAMPEALYIVDSFGNIEKNNLITMFYLIDKNLNRNISIGFHGHNNMQLAFANACDLVGLVTKRKLILDASVFGMGRGAGNLCTELIANYLNKYAEKKYNIEKMLGIFDKNLLHFYINNSWGYSMAYYLAAVKGCHPNYAAFLIGKQTLDTKKINMVLEAISDENRLFFKKDCIVHLYEAYQKKENGIADIKINKLKWEKEVLLLVPGVSVKSEKEKITEYIEKHNPHIMAINFVPDIDIKVDEVFITNNRRYQLIKDKLTNEKLIFSSNVKRENGYGIVINYDDLVNDSEYVCDDAGLMGIRYLQIKGVTKLFLAGFDGYKTNSASNHITEIFDNVIEKEILEEKNQEIERYLKKFAQEIEIEFLTETLYKLKG